MAQNVARQVWEDGRALARGAGEIVRRRWVMLAILIVGLAVVAGALVHVESGWAGLPTDYDAALPLTPWAKQLSKWGEFHRSPLIVAGTLWLLGWWKRSRRWQVAGLACLLAAGMAGGLAYSSKSLAGRARPTSGLARGFYGPHTDSAYNSFPSGHAATVFGSATALAVIVPPVGLPAMAGAAAVAWSRYYLGRHYPSDILVGVALGLVCGGVLGAAGRLVTGVQFRPLGRTLTLTLSRARHGRGDPVSSPPSSGGED